MWRVEIVVVFKIQFCLVQTCVLCICQSNGTHSKYVPLDQGAQSESFHALTSIGKLVVGAVVMLLVLFKHKENGLNN